MKKMFGLLIGLLMVLWMTSAASAGTISYSTTDLSPMSHGNYYIWNLNGINLSGQTITGATLTFNNLSDWISFDTLYVNLLSSAAAPPSLTSITSGTYYGSDNYFNTNYTPNDSLGSLTGLYSNQTATITIPTSDFSFLTDPTFGIGFNPHCVFTDNNVTLSVTTSPVSAPEPSAFLLLGFGLAGLAIFTRKFRKTLTTPS